MKQDNMNTVPGPGPYTVEREGDPGQWVGMATTSSYWQAMDLAHDTHRRVRNAEGRVVFPICKAAWWDLVGMILTSDKRLLVIVPALVAISWLIGKFF